MLIRSCPRRTGRLPASPGSRPPPDVGPGGRGAASGVGRQVPMPGCR